MHDTLITQLGSTDMIARRHAQEELMQLGAEAVAPLLHSLQTSSDYRQKIAIIAVLANIGDVRAVDALIRELETGNLSVRIMSAEALGNFHTPQVFEALQRRLNAEEVMVQIWIVESLGKLGNRHAVGLLIEALHHTTSSALQYSIIRVLGDLGDPSAINHITPYAKEHGLVQSIAQTVLHRLSEGS
jgi:HEAT repeat protein